MQRVKWHVGKSLTETLVEYVLWCGFERSGDFCVNLVVASLRSVETKIHLLSLACVLGKIKQLLLEWQ